MKSGLKPIDLHRFTQSPIFINQPDLEGEANARPQTETEEEQKSYERIHFLSFSPSSSRGSRLSIPDLHMMRSQQTIKEHKADLPAQAGPSLPRTGERGRSQFRKSPQEGSTCHEESLGLDEEDIRAFCLISSFLFRSTPLSLLWLS